LALPLISTSNSAMSSKGTALLRRSSGHDVDRQHPTLAADSEVLPPIGDEGAWMVTRGPNRLFHVSEAFASACQLMDGTRTVDDIASELGAPWEPQNLIAVVDRLEEHQILDDGMSQHKARRWNFSPPAAFQISLLDPTKTLAPALPLLRRLVRLQTSVLCGLIALAGVVSIVAQWDEFVSVLSVPTSFWVYVAVLGGFLAATAVHEIAHAAVLMAHGGRPKRIGFMFFYFMPAFFADVSDGWRLPRREQRAQVAFAGIIAQSAVSGSAALLTLLVEGNAQAALFIFAATTYASGLLNLIPLVKLDGYIALMAMTDVSHLRDRAMADARSKIASILFGSKHRPTLSEIWWAQPFGFACIAFPLVLLGQALRLWSEYLALFGTTAIFFRWGIALALLIFLGVRLRRLLSESIQNGASLPRLGLVCIVLAASIGLLGAYVDVPISYDAGYFTDESGEVVIVLPSSSTGSYLTEGAEVTFKSAGPVLQPVLGSGRLGPIDLESRIGPLAATTPTTAQLPQPFGYTLLAEQIDGDIAAAGIASIDGDQVNGWTWLLRRFIF